MSSVGHNGSDDRQSANRANGKRIGELLIDAGLISGRQRDEALARQGNRGGKMVDTLIFLGHMDSVRFVEFLAKQPGIPSISLKHCHVDERLLELLPAEIAVKHEVFPIDKMGRLLTVGMVCPLDKKAIAELESVTGLKVKAMLCTHREVREAIGRYYMKEGTIFSDSFAYRFR